MDEARPYMMQIASALLVIGFFIRRFADPSPSRGWLAALGIGLVLLCGSSMLGALWAGAALLLCLIARKDLGLRRQDWMVIGGTVVVLLAMGGYFVSTFLRDAKPTHGETNLLNLAFAAYELLGCVGLGPGREGIRLQGIAAFKAHFGALLQGATIISGFSLAGLMWAWRNLPRRAWIAVVLWALPVVILFMLSAVSHSRLLGRHLTPVFPVFVLLAAGGIVAMLEWMRRGTGFRITTASGSVFILFGAFAFSSYEIRLAPRHGKEDYRTAAAQAQAALDQGKSIWWCANPQGGHYYGLQISPDGEDRNAKFVRSPSREELSHVRLPDVVLLTRPDVYDEGHDLLPFLIERRWVSSASARGFVTWVPHSSAED
jgi:hypothetical protein